MLLPIGKENIMSPYYWPYETEEQKRDREFEEDRKRSRGKKQRNDHLKGLDHDDMYYDYFGNEA